MFKVIDRYPTAKPATYKKELASRSDATLFLLHAFRQQAGQAFSSRSLTTTTPTEKVVFLLPSGVVPIAEIGSAQVPRSGHQPYLSHSHPI